MTTSRSFRVFGRLDAGRVMGMASALVLPISLFAPKGMAPLFGIAALLIIGLSLGRYRGLSILPKPVTLAIGAFIVFAALSAFWSVTPGPSLYAALVLGVTCFGGLVMVMATSRLTAREREFFEKAVIYGGAIGFALFLFEYASNGSLKQVLVEAFHGGARPGKIYDPAFGPGLAVYALYVWPWVVAVKKRWGTVAVILAIAVSFTALAMGRANSPVLALGIGMAVALAALLSGRLIASLTAVIMVVGIAFMPFLPGSLPNPESETHRLSFLSHSALHRLAIWNTAVERMKERPVLGFGMNATRSLYSDKDKIRRDYYTGDTDKKWFNTFEPIPLHAHNGILQIWLELGIGGALLLGAIILSLIRRIRNSFQDPVWMAACLGLLICALIIFSLSFGPWQSWWQATLWLSGAIMVGLRNDGETDRPAGAGAG